MRSRIPPIIVSAVAVVFAGCGGDAEIPDIAAESFILYSIDGRDETDGKAIKSGERLHGFPVLGKLDVKDAKTRDELITAFKKGILRGDGSVAACFWPRHAIRTSQNGEIRDYVICFECHQYVVYRGGKSSDAQPIDGSPSEKFNEILQRANIPLAPPPFK